MHVAFAPHARRLGVAAGVAVSLLSLVCVCVLSVGLLTLPSPDHQIQPPWFTLMEILIIALSPAMVALTVALHASAPRERKSLALASVTFMSMSATVTSAVHVSILSLRTQPALVADDWARRVFSFEWPSIAYALDILAWDVLFPLAALLAATAVHGGGRGSWPSVRRRQ